MSLDTKLGAGTLAALTAVFTTAHAGGVITQTDQSDGSVTVEIAWGGGWPTGHVLRFSVTGTTPNCNVHFSFLSFTCAPPATGKRDAAALVYKSLCRFLPVAMKAKGVASLTASPYDAASTTVLQTHSATFDTHGIGFVAQPDGTLKWVL